MMTDDHGPQKQPFSVRQIEAQRKSLDSHLELCSEIVSGWPEWKRNALGDLSHSKPTIHNPQPQTHSQES